jgi:ankyrin repeat protein
MIRWPRERRGRSARAALTWAAAFAVIVCGDGRAQQALPLIDAARHGTLDSVRALLRSGADANVKAGDGATALHWASDRDDVAMAEALIRAGANVNAANDLGATPLWLASQNGSAAMVRRLLESGATPDRALLSGETPLMVAARAGASEVVARLADAGANPNARASRGQTALMWAVAQKHAHVVQVLLARGADLHARSDIWHEVMAVPPHGMLEYNRTIPHGGDTALLFAARVGDLACATLLAAAGANVNDEDAWGVSAVVLAAHSGFTDVVRFLLDRGADPSADRAGFGALHEAIMRRDDAMVAVLLEHGANPNARLRTWTPTRRSSKDWNFAPELVGATPLWLAARFAQPGVMRLLLARGADARFVHHVSYHTETAEARTEATTALMAATGMGGGVAWVRPARAEPEAQVLEAATIAIEHGVDVNAANTDGRTALDQARAARHQRVVDLLLAHGARSGGK